MLFAGRCMLRGKVRINWKSCIRWVALLLIPSMVVTSGSTLVAGAPNASASPPPVTPITLDITTPGGSVWTAPSGIYGQVTFTAYGAKGGAAGDGTLGGDGGIVAGSMDVSAGQQFDVYVGANGNSGLGTNGGTSPVTESGSILGVFNGGQGGNAGVGSYGGGGGGGASAVADPSAGSFMVIAGGGGGAGGGGYDTCGGVNSGSVGSPGGSSQGAYGGVGAGVTGGGATYANGGGGGGANGYVTSSGQLIAIGSGESGFQGEAASSSIPGTSGNAGGAYPGVAGGGSAGNGSSHGGYCTTGGGGGGGGGGFGAGGGGAGGGTGGAGGGGGAGGSTIDTNLVTQINFGGSSTRPKVTISYELLDTVPVISSAPSTTFEDGVHGSVQETTSNTVGTVIWSLTGAPSWVSINSQSGLISGTPPAGSSDDYLTSVSLVISASNAAGTDTQNFKINLTSPPIISGPPSATFVAGEPNGDALQAVTWIVNAIPAPTSVTYGGILPTGVKAEFDSTNDTYVLSGNPPAGTVGRYQLVITATNSIGSISCPITINVDASGTFTVPAPTTGQIPAIEVDSGAPFTYQIVTSGFFPHPLLSVESTPDLPKGVTFTDDGNGTGVLSGSAGAVIAATSYDLVFSASNGDGLPPVSYAVVFTLEPPGTTIAVCPAGDVCGEPATAEVPTQTTSLVATAADSAVSLTWTAPSYNGGSQILGYNIFEATTSGGEPATPINAYPIQATSYTVNRLTNNTRYYFFVKAVNRVGSGAASNEVSAIPVNSGQAASAGSTVSNRPGGASTIASTNSSTGNASNVVKTVVYTKTVELKQRLVGYMFTMTLSGVKHLVLRCMVSPMGVNPQVRGGKLTLFGFDTQCDDKGTAVYVSGIARLIPKVIYVNKRQAIHRREWKGTVRLSVPRDLINIRLSPRAIGAAHGSTIVTVASGMATVAVIVRRAAGTQTAHRGHKDMRFSERRVRGPFRLRFTYTPVTRPIR